VVKKFSGRARAHPVRRHAGFQGRPAWRTASAAAGLDLVTICGTDIAVVTRSRTSGRPVARLSSVGLRTLHVDPQLILFTLRLSAASPDGKKTRWRSEPGGEVGATTPIPSLLSRHGRSPAPQSAPRTGYRTASTVTSKVCRNPGPTLLHSSMVCNVFHFD
jgi:hypothetical protein